MPILTRSLSGIESLWWEGTWLSSLYQKLSVPLAVLCLQTFQAVKREKVGSLQQWQWLRISQLWQGVKSEKWWVATGCLRREFLAETWTRASRPKKSQLRFDSQTRALTEAYQSRSQTPATSSREARWPKTRGGRVGSHSTDLRSVSKHWWRLHLSVHREASWTYLFTPYADMQFA